MITFQLHATYRLRVATDSGGHYRILGHCAVSRAD